MRQIKFGDLTVGPLARRRIAEALDRNWVTEGPNVREFEEKFAEKFGWRHCVATSSGTTAGEVAWAAVRELTGETHGIWLTEPGGSPPAVITPACAFVATASCLLGAGLMPRFVDADLETLNSAPSLVAKEFDQWSRNPIAIQFVATMGKPTPIKETAKTAEERGLWLIGDWCEAHGAMLITGPDDFHENYSYAEHYCDAAIYSFYVAHLIQGGEGGCICTDDDEIADLCRSIKSHGRPLGSNEFQFDRVSFNAKWTDLQAAIALDSLERFDEIFNRRREIRTMFLEHLQPLENQLILYRDSPGEIIAPHAFPVIIRDGFGDAASLRKYLNDAGIETKSLFGSLPTDHKAFNFLGHHKGEFPVAERLGKMGLHWGCHENMNEEDVAYICKKVREHFGL